jgi:Capsule polysaccharide export protein
MNSSDHINIVFSADAKFVPYFATSLFSLLKNLSDPRKLNVFLLTDDTFTVDAQEKILSMRATREFDLYPIVVDASKYKSVKTTVGISVAAYNRLFMDAILPADVDRVIYLDSDLIIEKNIAEIYDLDMDGLLFRGVEDSISSVYKSRYDLPPSSHHINSGVMLCNVALMRESGFDQRITDFMEIHRYRIVMGDQQIINEVFFNQIGSLPLQWNVHGSMFVRGWAAQKVGVDNTMDAGEVAEAVRSPAVIHYTFKRKPWMSLEHPRARTWHRYNEKTPFKVGLPGGAKPTRANQNRSQKKQQPLAYRVARFVDAKIGGYLKSIFLLRKTQLELMKISKQLTHLAKTAATPLIKLDTPLHEKAREALLKSILTEMGKAKSESDFSARGFVASLQDGSSVLCNALQKDLDGGFNENLKTILRTADISKDNTSSADFAMILVHRVHLPEFWQVINTAYFYDLPLVFVEMNFFAAFSTYFDKTSAPAERRSLGFIIDDMGSYFDARQPSRIETTLNNNDFSLTADERIRAANLIDMIKSRRLTKYNKYVPSVPSPATIEEDAVVVIDQKRGDASIDFARADNRTFDRMLQAAITENPGKKIYLKAHPDNLHRGAESQSSLTHPRVEILADEIAAPDLLDMAGKVYVVSSQMGFEALLRGKQVITFGLPFYAGWGLTDDRCSVPRRRTKRTVEDLFFVTCIKQSVYINPRTGKLIEMEEMFDLIEAMRDRFQAPRLDREAAE